MVATTSEEIAVRLWTEVDRLVKSLPEDFDISELRKAISYLRAHDNDMSRLLRYLKELSTNRDFGRSNQTPKHRTALYQAVSSLRHLNTDELPFVLGNAVRLLVDRAMAHQRGN